jgi:hypothetical protein
MRTGSSSSSTVRLRASNAASGYQRQLSRSYIAMGASPRCPRDAANARWCWATWTPGLPVEIPASLRPAPKGTAWYETSQIPRRRRAPSCPLLPRRRRALCCPLLPERLRTLSCPLLPRRRRALDSPDPSYCLDASAPRAGFLLPQRRRHLAGPIPPRCWRSRGCPHTATRSATFACGGSCTSLSRCAIGYQLICRPLFFSQIREVDAAMILPFSPVFFLCSGL